jgi:hypothetical protein
MRMDEENKQLQMYGTLKTENRHSPAKFDGCQMISRCSQSKLKVGDYPAGTRLRCEFPRELVCTLVSTQAANVANDRVPCVQRAD